MNKGHRSRIQTRDHEADRDDAPLVSSHFSGHCCSTRRDHLTDASFLADAPSWFRLPHNKRPTLFVRMSTSLGHDDRSTFVHHISHSRLMIAVSQTQLISCRSILNRGPLPLTTK